MSRPSWFERVWNVVRKNTVMIPYIAGCVTVILILAVRDIWW